LRVGATRAVLQGIRSRCSKRSRCRKLHPRCRRRSCSCEIGVSFRVLNSTAVAPVLVRRSRLAVGPLPRLPGFSATDRDRHRSEADHILFSSSRSLSSFAQRNLAGGRSHQLLSWTLVPFSTSRRRGPLTAGIPAPATVRPQGLTTLSTVFALATRAGLISYRRRSWDSPFGASLPREVPDRFRPDAPTCRFSPQYSRRRRRRPVPRRRGSWASCLARVPAGETRG
jgi:hypothetical protein